MARRVFFSFHYQNDVWRANEVRNSATIEGCAAAGFQDASLWEEAKKKGDAAIKKLIDKGLENTTVTVVLVGIKTAGRKYVKYEINKSIARGNGLLGVYIHGLKNQDGKKALLKGKNPFDNLLLTRNGKKVLLSKVYESYDWVQDEGYANFGKWVDAAAKAAGK